MCKYLKERNLGLDLLQREYLLIWPKQIDAKKKWRMTETLAYGYSSESTL